MEICDLNTQIYVTISNDWFGGGREKGEREGVQREGLSRFEMEGLSRFLMKKQFSPSVGIGRGF